VKTQFLLFGLAPACIFILAACGQPEPVTPDRYIDPDRLFSIVETNIADSDTLEKIVEIDHSRLGAEVGSVMPPARVLIFSDPLLEAELIRINPLTAIDLPLRVLAYESVPEGSSQLIYNSFDYLRSRYELDEVSALSSRYEAAMSAALQGIPAESVHSFDNDTMQPDGIVTINSPFDFATTRERVLAAVDSQDDAVVFGELDLQSRARSVGLDVLPARMILFGAPGPGAKAMSTAPTLGLDAFCQKFLVWQDGAGNSYLSYNDLLDSADRQGARKNIALRVIDYRLGSTFDKALEPQ
jgi:uncharacterized protein (DUF302 family)